MGGGATAKGKFVSEKAIISECSIRPVTSMTIRVGLYGSISLTPL